MIDTCKATRECVLNASSISGVTCTGFHQLGRVEPTVSPTFIFGGSKLGAVVLLLTRASDSAVISIRIRAQGWYNQDGLHLPIITSFLAGYVNHEIYRDFFQFYIPSGPIYKAAILRFSQVGFSFNGESLTQATYNVHLFQGNQFDVTALNGNGNGQIIFSQFASSPIVSSNPFNPNTGPLAPFTAVLDASAISTINTLSRSGGGFITFSGTYDVGTILTLVE